MVFIYPYIKIIGWSYELCKVVWLITSIPVIVVGNGLFWVGRVHPGEENSPVLDVGAPNHSRSGRGRMRGKNCLCFKDSSQAFLAGVVVKDGRMSHAVKSDSTVAALFSVCNRCEQTAPAADINVWFGSVSLTSLFPNIWFCYLFVVPWCTSGLNKFVFSVWVEKCYELTDRHASSTVLFRCFDSWKYSFKEKINFQHCVMRQRQQDNGFHKKTVIKLNFY